MGKPRVAALQVGLQAKGLYGGTIDGYYGPATERAVRRLQRRAGLSVDGIAGPRTRRALALLSRHGYRIAHVTDKGMEYTFVDSGKGEE